jgi:hypothetical protein
MEKRQHRDGRQINKINCSSLIYGKGQAPVLIVVRASSVDVSKLVSDAIFIMFWMLWQDLGADKLMPK